MKKRIFIMTIVLVLGLVSSSFVSFGEQKINVFMDNNKMSFDVDPVIMNGRTLVAMRPIFEAFGMEVQWDQQTKTVYAAGEAFYCTEITVDLNKAKRYQLIADSANMELPFNKMEKQNIIVMNMDAPARIINGRTMVPLRFIAESFGCQVSYNDTTKRIDITTGSGGNSMVESSTSSSSSQTLDISGKPLSIGDQVKAYTPTYDIFVGKIVDVKGNQIQVEWYDIVNFFDISRLSEFMLNPTDFNRVQYMGGITFSIPQWIDGGRVSLDN